MKSKAAIFRAAADDIRRNGWNQGEDTPDGKRRCALNALLASSRVEASTSSTPRGGAGEFTCGTGRRACKEASYSWFSVAALAAERATGHADPLLLVPWNDAPGRRAEEVVGLFESLADDEELKEAIQQSRGASSAYARRVSKVVALARTFLRRSWLQLRAHVPELGEETLAERRL